MSSIGHPQAPDPPPPEPRKKDSEKRDPTWEPGSLDSFPREEITALVSQAEAKRARKETLQVWALGLGLGCVALGLPTERLWASEDIVAQVAGDGPSAFGLVVPLASLLHHLAGMSAERALFLVAALSYGLLLPALRSLMRTIGFPHGLSLAASSAVVLSPGVWLCATLPLDFIPGALGATLLARSLFQTEQRTKQGYQWRASTLTLLAFLLGPENLLLIPAVAWAVSSHPSSRRLPRFFPAFNLILVLAVALVVLMVSPGGSLHKWRDLLEALLAGGSMDPILKLRWLVWLPAYLGLSAAGLWFLFFSRRAAEETPPPGWVVYWCLAALVPVLGGTLPHGPVAGFLAPMAAIGIADWLMRMDREERVVPWAMGLLAAQLGLTLGATYWMYQTDPHAAFRRVATEVLEPSDRVVTSDPDHHYLLERRWGVSVAVQPQDFEQPISPADTLIFDGWDNNGYESELLQFGQALLLTPEGLSPNRRGERRP